MKQIKPDFKTLSLEFVFNVDDGGAMRVDGHVRLNGKKVRIDKFTNPQLFAFYQLLTEGTAPYYNTAVQLCLERGLVKLAPDGNMSIDNTDNAN